jgi:hypothetical protein
MPIAPGSSGNPRGRPRKGTSLTEMLRTRLGRKALREELADVLMQLALSGNLRAIELILDRTEGKVTQPHVTNFERAEAERIAAEYGLSADEVMAEAERIARGRWNG